MIKITPLATLKTAVFILIIYSLSGCNPRQNEQSSKIIQSLKSRRVILPNGWALTPPEKSLPLDELPLNLQVSANGRLAAVTNSGYGPHSVMLFDTEKETLLDRLPLPRTWYGLKFSPDGQYLFVAGGHDNLIYQLSVANQKLEPFDTLQLGDRWPVKIGPAGLDISDDGDVLYAVTREDSALYQVMLNTKKIARFPLPSSAYACVAHDDKLYISLWGSGQVAVFDLTNQHIEKSIEVGSHPNELLLSVDNNFLFVANANENSVSVIDLAKGSVIETIGTALTPNAPAGSTPNGLALSSDGSTLYIANADNNCLAVFDISTPGDSHALGFIPTGWYPTSVKSIDDKIWVTNGKGEQSGANPNGPNPYKHMTDSTTYSGRMFKGSLSFIPAPDKNTLAGYTTLVKENTPFGKPQKQPDTKTAIPAAPGEASPIKYVFYIIKENRTYDQVFGDMAEGNGDSTLCLFGRDITPNHHKLVSEFTLFDNFYVNAEVSADGHNWSMAAYATDFTEKTWPTNYGSKGGNYDFEGSRAIAFPKDGYIWDYCQRAGISYRSYGEFIDNGKTNMKALKDHYDPDFVGFDLSIMDTTRLRIWRQDFDSLMAAGEVPRFNIIRLPNDHTSGARLGRPTPQSQVADNDLALGMLVDYLSHSKIWAQSAIFVVEDDAQNGPDHVDAHRSLLLAISPYTRKHYVDSHLYSTAAVLRTMELILGLPPMSQYDAAALPLYASFTDQPDPAPYTFVPNSYPLNEMNTNQTLSERSAGFDLESEDAADDIALNRVIWQTVKGLDNPMPAPRRSAFVFSMEDEEDDG